MINKNPSKEIRVCHVTSAHTRYDVRIFHKECKSLANNGFDVTLLVNDNLPNEFIDGVKIVSTKLKPKNRYERMVKAKKYIKKNMIDIDANIYHFHDPELLLEADWIKNKGKKVIFDFHEDVPQQILYKKWIPQKVRRIVSLVYKIYEKNKAKKYDALITVTPKFVDRLSQINPNTIMITNYPIFREKYRIDNSTKKRAICFAGGITPQWHHENIIKAIEKIEDIEYILAGSGSQEYINQLQTLEGWKKVRYLGRVPYEKVQEIYSESMMGIALLSNNTQVGDEGTLGNTKIFEFMEAGLPIICSNNKLWKEIIEKYECGIVVDPNNVMEIQKEIKKVLNNKSSILTMGKNGRKACEVEFNWASQEELLDQVYKKVITGDLYNET